MHINCSHKLVGSPLVIPLVCQGDWTSYILVKLYICTCLFGYGKTVDFVSPPPHNPGKFGSSIRLGFRVRIWLKTKLRTEPGKNILTHLVLVCNPPDRPTAHWGTPSCQVPKYFKTSNPASKHCGAQTPLIIILNLPPSPTGPMCSYTSAI